MRIAYKAGLLLFAITVLVGLSTLNPTFGKELVGIVPFTNQRDNPADNWLGYYFQARMQSYLENACDCSFHSLNTVRMWQLAAEPSNPISIQNTVLITGSYQVVLGYCMVEIQMKRFSPVSKADTVEISFADDDLEVEMDRLFSSIAEWISPQVKRSQRIDFLGHSEPDIKALFQFRERLLSPDKNLEMRHLQPLRDTVKPESQADFISDLAEGMIIVASSLPEAQRRTLWDETERLLRSAAMIHLKNSRIHSLLATVFFLNNKEGAWVKKTAEEAYESDRFNELALLMIILSSAEETKRDNSTLRKLNDVNPWIWPDDAVVGETALFQKGLFSSELLILRELLF